MTTFVAVALKGFQHKNVIGNHLKSVVLTSYFMAIADVAATLLIISTGWTIAISAGSGAALGMLFSIKLHDRLFKNKGKVHDRTNTCPQ